MNREPTGLRSPVWVRMDRQIGVLVNPTRIDDGPMQFQECGMIATGDRLKCRDLTISLDESVGNVESQ